MTFHLHSSSNVSYNNIALLQHQNTIPLYLPVCPDYRTKQFPRSTSPVHPYHAQDLKKAEAAQSWSGKNFSAGSKTQDDDASSDNHHICTSISTKYDMFTCRWTVNSTAII